MAKSLSQIAQEFLRGPDTAGMGAPTYGARAQRSQFDITEEMREMRALERALRNNNYEQALDTAQMKALAVAQNNAMANHNPFGGGLAGMGLRATKPPPPTQEEEEAWSVPISTLCDMWEMRFGDGWVNEKDIDKNVMLYIIGKQRLHRLLKLEERDHAFYGVAYRLIK